MTQENASSTQNNYSLEFIYYATCHIHIHQDRVQSNVEIGFRQSSAKTAPNSTL